MPLVASYYRNRISSGLMSHLARMQTLSYLCSWILPNKYMQFSYQASHPFEWLSAPGLTCCLDEQQRTLSEKWGPTFLFQGEIPWYLAWPVGYLTADSAGQIPFCWLSPVHRIKCWQSCNAIIYLTRVVRKVDNAIYRINHFPADSVVCFFLHFNIDWIVIYPVDSVIQPSNNWDLCSYWSLYGHEAMAKSTGSYIRDQCSVFSISRITSEVVLMTPFLAFSWLSVHARGLKIWILFCRVENNRLLTRCPSS